MKKTILMTLTVIVFTAFVTIQTAKAQEEMEAWPGVMIKVLTENDKVKVFKVTFAKGAVADWHNHPAHTVYATTKVKMKAEEEGKAASIIELMAGQAVYSPAVKHRTSNIGKKKFTLIVTEIK